VRLALPDDAMAIATIHADNWQRSYRGILRDDYLDGPVIGDRQVVWKRRLSNSADSSLQFIAVIERPGGLAAFVCAYLDADPEWGALLDNLHVAFASRGQRLGLRLMACAAAWVIAERPASRLHLWTYEKNRPARRYYERLGGEVVNQHAEPAPDGSHVRAVRYGWRDPFILAAAADRSHR
jgi:GNAT superfamily N-acetyltransferase